MRSLSLTILPVCVIIKINNVSEKLCLKKKRLKSDLPI